MTLATRATVMVLGLIQSVLLAHALGVAGRGVLAAIAGFAFILVQLATLGLPTAGPWLLAREREQRAEIVSALLWLAVGAGLAAGATGALLSFGVREIVSGASALELGLGLAAVPALLLVQVMPSVLLGESRLATYNGLSLLTALLPTAAVGALVVSTDPSLEQVLAVTLTASTATALVMTVTAVGRSVTRRPDTRVVRRLVAYGVRVYSASVLAYLVIRVDLLLLNAIAGSESAGHYAVAVSFADVLYVVPVAVGLTLFSRVAGVSGLALTEATLKRVAPFYAVVCAVAAIVVGPIVDFLFGEEFGPAGSYFRLLVPGIFALGMTSIISQHYAAVGFPRRLVVSWLVALVANVALNAVLLPAADPRAVAVISSVTYALVLAVHVDSLRRDRRASAARQDAAKL